MKKKVETTRDNQPGGALKPAQRADGTMNTQAKSEDILDLIERDHGPLKELIQTLKDGELEREDKESALEEFVPLLVSHAKAEEKSLYIQMKEIKDLRVDGYEGDTEHGIAEQLVHEIHGTADDDEWNAKVKVLAELVEHHIEEEEDEMFKDVEEAMDVAARQAVGAIYTQIKTEIDILRQIPAQKSPSAAELRLN